MTERNDGGPAFPMPFFAAACGENTTLDVTQQSDWQQGMSLRQWYAGMAMRLFVWSAYDDLQIEEAVQLEQTAKRCFKMADAMLAAGAAKSPASDRAPGQGDVTA